MEKKTRKEMYASPAIQIVEMKVEGIVCGSGSGEDMEWD